MSDELDEMIDEEEYKKALELLEGSKRSKKKNKKASASQKSEVQADMKDGKGTSEDVAKDSDGEGQDDVNAGENDNGSAEDVKDNDSDATKAGSDDKESETSAGKENDDNDPERDGKEGDTEDDDNDPDGEDKEDGPEDDKESKTGEKAKGFGKSKKKLDPVIPICLILAVLVVVGVILYYTVPNIYRKSLGITVEELRTSYLTTPEYTDFLYGYGFAIPDATYTATANSNVNNFQVAIPNNATNDLLSIMGTTRSVDNQITKLRVMSSYSNADSYFDFLMLYHASYLHVFYPEYDSDTIRSMVTQCLANVGRAQTDYFVDGR
ncbi:MAG: hypothetical protein J5685_03035, partial [Clostridiales bacterium]|nr:hypothetical protein [Clostridiales bacterium]